MIETIELKYKVYLFGTVEGLATIYDSTNKDDVIFVGDLIEDMNADGLKFIPLEQRKKFYNTGTPHILVVCA